jgi:hypothetical protein
MKHNKEFQKFLNENYEPIGNDNYFEIDGNPRGHCTNHQKTIDEIKKSYLRKLAHEEVSKFNNKKGDR